MTLISSKLFGPIQIQDGSAGPTAFAFNISVFLRFILFGFMVTQCLLCFCWKIQEGPGVGHYLNIAPVRIEILFGSLHWCHYAQCSSQWSRIKIFFQKLKLSIEEKLFYSFNSNADVSRSTIWEFSPEGVSSTMFFTSNDKNIYLKMWILPFL